MSEPTIVRAYALREQAMREVMKRYKAPTNPELALAIQEHYHKLRAFALACGQVIDDQAP